MFADRLSSLINECGAKNRWIARAGGFDASIISHLQNGSRLPDRESPTIRKLCTGIYLYMDEMNETDKLCSLTGTDPDLDAEAIIDSIAVWLYADESFDGQENTVLSKRRNSRRKTPTPSENRAFGNRLDAMMTLAELSNIRFSHLVRVDASLISRFRSGIRTPSSNPAIAKSISSVLWNRLQSLNRLDQLSKEMNVPENELSENAFHRWLFDFDEHPENINASSTERLLEAFDSYSIQTGIQLPSFEEAVPEQILNDSAEIYEGYEGMRNAVIRFLGNAVKDRSSELLLYSDQNMDWMVGDPAFFAKWAALMSACVQNGTRIRIIHSIDRSLNEMYNAIISWVPLYLSGMIDSYYSTLEKGGRTSLTLFLDPQKACISASHVIGTEEEGYYHYYTKETDLDFQSKQFDQLMRSAQQLVEIATKNAEFMPQSDTVLIQPTLSLLSMPYELVSSFNDDELTKEWEKRNLSLDHLLSNGFHECIPLAADEELFRNEVPVETLPGSAKICYSSEQYAMHIQNVIRLLEKYPSYRLIPLPQVPFGNMQLISCMDQVRVRRASAPNPTLVFKHPLICSAFRDYCERLTKPYKMDKKTMIRYLENRYL